MRAGPTGPGRGRRSAACAAALTLATGASLAGAAAPAGAATTRPAPTSVTVVGHGWGHGRGLGQWGALGYAVDQGWSSAAILNHYYGGTHARHVGATTVSVELTALAGAPVTVTGRSLRVNGRTAGGFVRVNRVASDRFRVYRGDACTGTFTPWFTASAVDVASAGDASKPADAVQVCSGAGTVGYRGALKVFDGGDAMRVLNVLSVESYLRGVVPRESPPQWGDAGHGRGMQALAAQAVAARSYVLSSRRRWSTTCDSTACQVYGGWFTVRGGVTHLVDDPRSDAAVRATAGLVRAWPDGSIVRTEFSSSTGGYSAGGAFPAVRDTGDAVAGNPRHDWSETLSWATLTRRLGLGPVTNITVSRRQYVGRVPNRALLVRVTRADGRTVTLTGEDVRARLGLHSDWISFLQHRE